MNILLIDKLQISSSIKEILIKNSTLQELYMHWNNLKSLSLYNIFTGLINNDSLKVLDLSWNSMGAGKQNYLQVNLYLLIN